MLYAWGVMEGEVAVRRPLPRRRAYYVIAH
jgi:hypothetical protein